MAVDVYFSYGYQVSKHITILGRKSLLRIMIWIRKKPLKKGARLSLITCLKLKFSQYFCRSVSIVNINHSDGVITVIYVYNFTGDGFTKR